MSKATKLKSYCGECQTHHEVAPHYNSWLEVLPPVKWHNLTIVGDRHLLCGRRQYLVLEREHPEQLCNADIHHTLMADAVDTSL